MVQLISSPRQERGLENENGGTEQRAEEWQVAAVLSGLEKNQGTFAGEKAEMLQCVKASFLYLVLDLNFFPKALSSSGTDKVRVKEPSDSDLTTRALKEQWLKLERTDLGCFFQLKKKSPHRRQVYQIKKHLKQKCFMDWRAGQKDHFWASVTMKQKQSNPSLTLLISRGIPSPLQLCQTHVLELMSWQEKLLFWLAALTSYRVVTSLPVLWWSQI